MTALLPPVERRTRSSEPLRPDWVGVLASLTGLRRDEVEQRIQEANQ